MPVIQRISAWIDAINTWIGRMTQGLVLVMVVIGTWNVLGRYVGYWLGRQLSSNALLEAQWYLFDLVFLLGGAYTLRQNEHVRIDVLYNRFGRKGQAIANLVGIVLFLIPFCGIILYFSWTPIAMSWSIHETSPDPNGLPRYPIKTMLLVGVGLVLLQGIAEFGKNLLTVLTPSPPTSEPVEDSDAG